MFTIAHEIVAVSFSRSNIGFSLFYDTDGDSFPVWLLGSILHVHGFCRSVNVIREIIAILSRELIFDMQLYLCFLFSWNHRIWFISFESFFMVVI